jgi:SAM-dependent methyltransferase
MTSVDISARFLSAGRSLAAKQKAPITWIQRNMRDIEWQGEFDGAFCAGNSFGYLDDQENSDFLKAIFRALKPNSRFVLDASMCLEARLPTFRDKNWSQIGEYYFIEDERYDHVRGRIVTEYTLIRGQDVEKRMASHRCYTYRELRALLDAAGFGDVQSFGSAGGEPFRLGSTGLFLVATREP